MEASTNLKPPDRPWAPIQSPSNVKQQKKRRKDTAKKLERSESCSITTTSGQRRCFRLILGLVSCVIYLNSLNGDFVYDDRRVILENSDVVGGGGGGLGSWLRPFANDFWGTPMCNKGSHKSYRPLVILSFRLQTLVERQLLSLFSSANNNDRAGNAQIPSPIPFRLLNVLLHLLVVDLFFQLASSKNFQAILLLHTSRSKDTAAAIEQFRWRQELAAGLGALLFACHPIHVEAVASIVGRAELMGALFCLLSFRNLAASLSMNRGQSSRLLLARSALYAAATFLCKENHAFSVLALNGMLVGWFGLVEATSSQRRDHHRHHFKAAARRKRLKGRIWSSALTLFALLLCYVGVRRFIVTLGNSNDATTSTEMMPKFSIIDNPLRANAEQYCLKFSAHAAGSATDCSNEQHLSQLQTKLTLTRLYLPALNLVHLLNPSRPSYDWSLESIGLVENFAEWRLLAALATYAALLWFGVVWLVSLVVCGKEEAKHEGQNKSEEAASSEAESETSDTSSVKSASTTNSIDSGFVDCDKSNKNQEPNLIGGGGSSCSSGSGNASELRTEADCTMQRMLRMNSFGWSLVWLLVPLVPVTNVIFWVGFVLAERTLYLPSAGFCLLAANILVHLALGGEDKILPREKVNGGGNEKKIRLQLLLKLRAPELWRRALRGALIFEKSLHSPSWLKNGCPKLRPPLPPRTAKTTMETTTTQSRQTEDDSQSGSGSESRRKREESALLLALIFPLLIWGCLKTVDRNRAWLNERSLYSSNLAESPAKSLANLAALASHAGSRAQPAEQIYRAALAREPLSADLHYNLARALHGRAAAGEKAAPAAEAGADARPKLEPELELELKGKERDEVAYHYKLALELRHNFALAALNLAAYQYERLNQLDWALATFELCARMRSDETKSREQHVRVRIECLISGAKLWLAEAAADWRPRREPSSRASDAGADCASGEQQQTTNRAPRSLTSHANCPKVLELMHEAKSLAASIGVGVDSKNENESENDAGGGPILDELAELGDPARQMALVHWLSAECSAPASIGARREQLAAALEWANRSQVSLESRIYLDYASTIRGGDARVAFLSRAIASQQRKNRSEKNRRSHRQSLLELAKLHHELAKALAEGEKPIDDAGKVKKRLALAADQMDEAIRLNPDEPSFLSFGAQLAFDLGQLAKSERLYREALEHLLRRRKHNGLSTPAPTTLANKQQLQQQQHQQPADDGERWERKRRAQAHTNYGAILQVNGRLEEARGQYRRALDCDPANSIAARNLAQLR